MSGWLGPVSLRLVDHGALGGQPLLGPATLRPSYELGRPVLAQGPKCCNTPDGYTLCFDHSTGNCINTWKKGSPTAGAPGCVWSGEEWLHPECLPSPTPTQLGSGMIPVENLGVDQGPMMGKWQPHGWKFWERKPKRKAAPSSAAPAPAPAPTPTPTPTPNPNPTPTPTPSPMPSDGPSYIQNPTGVQTGPIPTEPIPATAGGQVVPVLPEPQEMTSASPPTGAWPGQPFAAAPQAPRGPIPTAKAPAPMPPPCPLGPVPLKQWIEGCMG